MLNDRYRIVRVLGRGGMGTVYLAEHIRLETVVAVKEVSGPRSNEDEYRLALQQCEQEAKFLVRLHHPNLPRVMDAFIENDRFYLVMEYIEGVTLENRMRDGGDGPLDVHEVVEWGLQIADVLAYLHSQEPPIIFRDLKPANIMVQPDGSVRLIDFGIARRFHPGASKDTALLGSVGYSPPEQFGRSQTDTRSDLYAFGATLHHLLTGRDPAAEPFKFPPARSLNPGIPEMLSYLLDDCLAMDVAQRPAGVHEVALRLLAIRDSLAANPSASPSALTPLVPADLTSAPSTTPVTGTAAGPRIISAKLAEAEAQRRRESREVRAPSGAASPGGEVRRGSRLVPTLLLLLIIFGGATAAIMMAKSGKTGNKQEPPRASNPAPDMPSSAKMPDPPAVSAPPTGADAAPVPPPAVNRVAEIGQALVQGITRDEQGNPYITLQVVGKIHGQTARAGMVSVFFYGPDGQPIPAADPKSVYANQNGQLSVAYSLDIQSEEFPYNIALYVPLAQFPKATLASGLQYRCVTFIDQKRVAETEMLPVPYDFSSAQTLPPTSGMTAPANSSRNSIGTGNNTQVTGGI